MASSKNYRPPLSVFTLVVLTSGDRHQRDIAVIDLDPHDLAGNPLREVSHKVIYLCPKYVSEATPEPCREWLRAINDTLNEEVDESQYGEGVIQKLFEAIRRDHLSPEERARMIEEYNQEELQQTMFEEGAMEAKRLVAKNCLLKGLAPELVAEATGLSMAEIVGLEEG
ncbi:MAG: hypothetical protein QTN59_00440 [Candidatus Electrothrix communis]|nr:MAG: hypothetical protein QTN59_00440 [Candidatus Electrothrix communis]